MTTPSFHIHDSSIYAYQMCAEEGGRTYALRLHAEYAQGGPVAYADICFGGVLAHHFENVRAGNIIFDIEQISMQQCYDEFEDIFTRLEGQDWPAPHSTPQELFALAARSPAKVYSISTSYGLCGWVWAERMEVAPRAGRAALEM